MKKYDLQATIARYHELMRRLLGPGPREQRHPTMEEDAAYDQEREAMQEYRECVLKLKAQNWLINGAPIILSAPSENVPFTTVATKNLIA